MVMRFAVPSPFGSSEVENRCALCVSTSLDTNGHVVTKEAAHG
jgi:hypothetical protein